MTDVPQTSVQNKVKKASCSSRLKLPQNLLQTIQIERYRLSFLRKCRQLKRPPQSLRVSGANALLNCLKLPLFSELETKLLLVAIEEKEKYLIKLQEQLKDTAQSVPALNKKVRKSWYIHFEKKFKFYQYQDQIKWTLWPIKISRIPLKNMSSNKRKSKNLRKKKKNIRQRAKYIRESKQVRVLMDIVVPDEAIVVLGKGLGFVPTPAVNSERTRLDARNLVNNITRKCKVTENVCNIQVNDTTTTSCIPKKLKHVNYAQNNYKIKDSSTKQAVDIINCKMNALSPNSKDKSPPKNLSYLENEGLKWLQNKTSNMEIAITKADKGGSILVVPPTLLENKIKDKVLDVSLFEQIDKDPRPNLYNDLHVHWVQGKLNKYVTAWEAEQIMGITEKNNKSTSSHFKPGITYFNPNLKIHKMREEDIVIGCNPPARLISCFQDGVTKRSDVFIATKWLKPLEDDYCSDIVTDTIQTLKWLDNLDTTHSDKEKKMFLPFTFDFEALYDSLSPDLVIEAVRFAINKHRKNWSRQFTEWLVKLIKISLKSGVGVFQDKWFQSKSGISTGGSLSVQLANIAVFYVLNKCIYSNKQLSKDIVSIIRFIDDGTGIFKGSFRQFLNWKKLVTGSLAEYNLKIPVKDWKVAKFVWLC